MVLSVLLCFSLVVSVDAASMWSQTYGGADTAEAAYSLIATSDGGYALAGSIAPSGTLNEDFWLVKTDALGNMEWNRTYGGWGSEIANSLVATSDGGYALAGRAIPFGAGYPPYYNYTFCLVKTDAVGNMQWNQTYGKGTTSSATSLIATADGGYAMAGYPFLFKTDALGNVEWNQTYPATAGWFPGEWSVVAASDGGYAIAGNSMSDFLLIKTDSLGNMQWNRTYGGPDTADVAYSLIVTSDGGYAIAGIFNTTDYTREGGTETDFYLVKTDASGNMQWNKTYERARNDHAWSLVATSDGGYALAGNAYASPYWNSTDFWLVKTDSFGNELWNRTYGGTGSDIAFSLVATSDGGYAIAGGTGSFGAGNVWLVKTDEFGVVPEYSSWLIPALVLTATAFIIINKKRLLHKRSRASTS